MLLKIKVELIFYLSFDVLDLVLLVLTPLKWALM